MIGVLLLAQQEIGRGFLAAAEHVLGRLPTQVEALPVNYPGSGFAPPLTPGRH